MNTGLTDDEKERLLKLFLCQLTINRVDVKSVFNHEIRFISSKQTITDDVAKLIIKAMNNLRGS